MKYNDLRIGNMLEHGEWADVIIVESIEENFINDPIFNYNFWDGKLQGICLTTEILEKCGFKKTDEHDYVQGHYKRMYDGYLYISDNESDWSCYLIDDMKIIKLRSIECMHELQNLVFVLDGEELELNVEDKNE